VFWACFWLFLSSLLSVSVSSSKLLVVLRLRKAVSGPVGMPESAHEQRRMEDRHPRQHLSNTRLLRCAHASLCSMFLLFSLLCWRPSLGQQSRRLRVGGKKETFQAVRIVRRAVQQESESTDREEEEEESERTSREKGNRVVGMIKLLSLAAALSYGKKERNGNTRDRKRICTPGDKITDGGGCRTPFTHSVSCSLCS
jgi:hypothetical protein